MTPLQRRFCRSKVLRRGMLGVIAAEVGSVKGCKRMWYSCVAYSMEKLPEADIKRRLFQLLQCSDITTEDVAEIRQLLNLSGTALTRRQRRQMQDILQED